MSDRGVASIDRLEDAPPPRPPPSPAAMAQPQVDARRLTDQRTLHGKGLGGQLTVDADWVTIDRKGAFAKMGHGLAGSKRIPIDMISSVQVKPATRVTNGYIQFGVPGGTESKRGIVEATQDENTVMFTKNQADAFEAIKAFVEAKIGERNRPHQQPAQQPQVVHQAATPSLADEIRKLGELRDAGLLTNEEFAAQKARLLT